MQKLAHCRASRFRVILIVASLHVGRASPCPERVPSGAAGNTRMDSKIVNNSNRVQYARQVQWAERNSGTHYATGKKRCKGSLIAAVLDRQTA